MSPTKQPVNSLNIFEGVSKEDYQRARKLMIECILATDMSQHFSELSKFKTRIGALDFEPKKKDKMMTLKMMFHLADISNATKEWNTCRKWTDLLFQELFAQGDLER